MTEENGPDIEDLDYKEVVELDITDIADNGDGVGRLEGGLVVLVEGAIDGKRVKAKITEKYDTYVKAELVEWVGDIEEDGEDDTEETSDEGGEINRDRDNWYGEA